MTAFGVLAETLAKTFPTDAAAALERLSTADVVALVSTMAPQTLAPVLGAMAPSLSRDVYAALEPDVAATLLEQLPAARAATTLRGVDSSRRDAVLAKMSPPRAQAIGRVLHHPGGSVGALADPEPLSLTGDLSVELALEQVRARPATETIYVVDRDTRLVGVATAGALIAAEPQRTLADVMDRQPDVADALADAGELVNHPAWGKVRALAVVDIERRLVGTISFEVIARVALNKPDTPASLISIPVSLAELFWLGLSGITEGFARTAARNEPRDD